LPLFYLIATRIRPELDLSSALALSCFVVTTIVLTCLTKNFEAISAAYFAISAFLNLLFIFAGRFRNRSDLFSLAFLPVVFLTSDAIRAYFSPYDIHFTNPVLDRLSESLIWIG